MNWNAPKYEAGYAFVWKYGEDLLAMLEPKPGERILDVGCGTGHLTAKLAAAGAVPTGLDSSADMIAQARAQYPAIEFVVEDAAQYKAARPFDAVFSNAALHWMRDADAVAAAIAGALVPGGRFVAELGGKGNVAAILEAASQILGRDANRWYFPSVGEYASVLERHGLEVRYAVLFDRPTELTDPQNGLRDWLAMFGGPGLQAIAGELEAALRPKLFRDGRWFADYRRLRIVAVRAAS